MVEITNSHRDFMRIRSLLTNEIVNAFLDYVEKHQQDEIGFQAGIRNYGQSFNFNDLLNKAEAVYSNFEYDHLTTQIKNFLISLSPADSIAIERLTGKYIQRFEWSVDLLEPREIEFKVIEDILKHTFGGSIKELESWLK